MDMVKVLIIIVLMSSYVFSQGKNITFSVTSDLSASGLSASDLSDIFNTPQPVKTENFFSAATPFEPKQENISFSDYFSFRNPCSKVCYLDESDKLFSLGEQLSCYCPKEISYNNDSKNKIIQITRKKITDQFFEEFKQSVEFNFFVNEVDHEYSRNENAGTIDDIRSETKEEIKGKRKRSEDCLMRINFDLEKVINSRREKVCPNNKLPIEKILMVDKSLKDKVLDISLDAENSVADISEPLISLKTSLDESMVFNFLIKKIVNDKNSLTLSNSEFLGHVQLTLSEGLKDKKFLADVCPDSSNILAQDMIFTGVKDLAEICKKFMSLDNNAYQTVMPDVAQIEKVKKGILKLVQIHPYVKNFFTNKNLREKIASDPDSPFSSYVIHPMVDAGAKVLDDSESKKCDELLDRVVEYSCLDDSDVLTLSKQFDVRSSLDSKDQEYLNCLEQKSDIPKMYFGFISPSIISNDKVRQDIDKDLKSWQQENKTFVDFASQESKRRVQDYKALTSLSGSERDEYFRRREEQRNYVTREINQQANLKKSSIDDSKSTPDVKNFTTIIPEKQSQTKEANVAELNSQNFNSQSTLNTFATTKMNSVNPSSELYQMREKIKGLEDSAREKEVKSELSKISDYEKRIKELEDSLSQAPVQKTENLLPSSASPVNRQIASVPSPQVISNPNFTNETFTTSGSQTLSNSQESQNSQSAQANFTGSTQKNNALSNLSRNKESLGNNSFLIQKATRDSGFYPSSSTGIVVKSEEMSKDQIVSELNQKILLGEMNDSDLIKLKGSSLIYKYFLQLPNGEKVEKEIKIDLKDLSPEVREKVLSGKESPQFKIKKKITELKRAHFLSSLRVLLLQEKKLPNTDQAKKEKTSDKY